VTAPEPGRLRQVYRFPRRPLVCWIPDFLAGRRRSLARDSRTTMDGNPPPPRVQGLEHVPPDAPFILITNHYGRDGLPIHFCAMAISAVVGERRPSSPEIRWVITSEWYGRRIGPLRAPVWLIRWAFRRIARLYGLVIMPRAVERKVGRAAAMRHIAEKVRAGETVGLVPEALGKGTLIEAVPGSGLLLLSASRGRVPIVPVGLWEENDELVVRFGEPFRLEVEAREREEQDRQARERVMVAIGRLLPERYWGFYADLVSRALEHSAE
jgi:1-acyl-sn-glycerol-3-phosphate acyltransferase